MAQLNITLNQDEVLALLAEDTGGAFRKILETALNGLLRAESAEQLRAAPYERTSERTDSRNGTRERSLVTRIGTIRLKVPRHREVPFKTLVFDNYRRGEAALLTVMAEMVVAGVSTAKVGRVMEEICGTPFSKQAVSEACAVLDGAVAEFGAREIPGQHPFVMLDATYVKVRENRRIVSKALLIAMGLTPGGGKEILGFGVADAETKESWAAFLASLKGRGLKGVRMVTSDACGGIIDAVQELLPGAAWQRCQAHLTRSIVDSVPKRYRAGLRSELAGMFNSATLAEARRRRDEIIADYAGIAPKAAERLDAGFDDAMTVMELPEQMRRCLRTSNCIERLNREVKRRSRVIGIFPNAGSAARLLGALLMEENERWLGMRRAYYRPAVEEFEERKPRLAEIAELQRRLRAAA